MASPMTRDWVEQGLCRTHPEPELWFPRRHDARSAARAKAICRGCPVRDTCLREALAFEDTWGIWAGTDETDRLAMNRKAGARVA